MNANLAPLLRFSLVPSTGAFAARMVRLAGLAPNAPEVPFLYIMLPTDTPTQLMSQGPTPAPFIALLKDLRLGGENTFRVFNLSCPAQGTESLAFSL